MLRDPDRASYSYVRCTKKDIKPEINNSMIYKKMT